MRGAYRRRQAGARKFFDALDGGAIGWQIVGLDGLGRSGRWRLLEKVCVGVGQLPEPVPLLVESCVDGLLSWWMAGRAWV